MSHTAIVFDHPTLRNYLLQHRVPLYFSKPVMGHIETYMTAATAKRFRLYTMPNSFSRITLMERAPFLKP